MMPIAVFYHCLFMYGDPPQLSPVAFLVVQEQMLNLETSGLLDAASEFVVGINGPIQESLDYARILIPKKAHIISHGPDSFSENQTIVELENWLVSHPDWYVLYFHAKGCTKVPGTVYFEVANRWRNCMTEHLVFNWTRCVRDLGNGHEAVGCHWLTSMGSDHSQSYFGGNFWFAKSSFLRTLPSIKERGRIKMSGIGSKESRYESEVWIGNGPRLPRVKDYANHRIYECL